MLIRQDAVLVGRPPWVAAAGGHHLPGFGSPGSGEPGTLGTHHHPGPADQTLNLREPANCRIKTNTQDGCQNFRFNALPVWERWAGLGRWATFGWQLQCWTAAPLSGWRAPLPLPPLPSLLSLPRGRAFPCEERPLVTSLTPATLSTSRTTIRREIRGLSPCLMLPERRKNGLFFHVGQPTFAW